MPIFIVSAIRTLIIFLLQSGAIVAIQYALAPLIDRAKSIISQNEGLNDEDSTSFVANMVLDIVELAGISILVFKSRLPLRIADKLGFTTKGFVRRGIPARVSSGPRSPGAVARSAKAGIVVPSVAEANAALSVLKASSAGARKALSFLEGKMSTAFLGIMAFTGVFDFANWETGAYSDSWQKVFETVSFGLIRPDEDYRKAKTASEDVFTKVWNTYKLNGAIAIRDPYKLQSVPFTRDNLLDLVDRIGAVSLAATGSASTKEILAASQTMIVFNFAAATGGSTPPTASTSGGGVASSSQAYSLPTTKVFTGVLTQGTLGNGIEFNARPDDLITSLGDLRAAAHNNLAPFLVALPNKVIYEVKVVSSVTGKDGFIQRGVAQQIVSGAYADGRPKYRTVVNKFAVMNLYILTDRGTRTKISQINLGPTDAVKFQPQLGDLSDLETALKSSIKTSNPEEIKKIIIPGTETSKDTRSEKDKEQDAEKEKEPAPRADGMRSFKLVSISKKGQRKTDSWLAKTAIEVLETAEKTVQVVSIDGLTPEQIRGGSVSSGASIGGGASSTSNLSIIKDPVTGNSYAKDNSIPGDTYKPYVPPSSSSTAPASGGTSENSSIKPKVCASGTLAEFYLLKGQSLPSLTERAQLYQREGLGQASFYVGSAEQNTKLLRSLLADEGC